MLCKETVKVAVAPINWTNDDLPELGGDIPLEQCLDEMQEAGYEGCEVGVKFPRDPEQLRPLLEKRGLQVCNQWASYRFSTQTFQQVKDDFIPLLDFLSAMGAKVVGGGEVGTSIQGDSSKALYGHKPVNSPEQWKNLCRGLEELGKIARDEYGIRLCFHHHMGTCVQTMEETEILLHETDPRYVSLNYDCGHFFASDEDPAEAAEHFSERIGHVHLKDLRLPVMKEMKERHMSFLDGVKSGFFTVPGDGDIGEARYRSIFSILEKASYSGWLVVEAEQDPAQANPLDYGRRGRDFVRRFTGV